MQGDAFHESITKTMVDANKWSCPEGISPTMFFPGSIGAWTTDQIASHKSAYIAYQMAFKRFVSKPKDWNDEAERAEAEKWTEIHLNSNMFEICSKAFYGGVSREDFLQTIKANKDSHEERKAASAKGGLKSGRKPPVHTEELEEDEEDTWSEDYLLEIQQAVADLKPGHTFEDEESDDWDSTILGLHLSKKDVSSRKTYANKHPKARERCFKELEAALKEFHDGGELDVVRLAKIDSRMASIN
jgi:hypothetical protein